MLPQNEAVIAAAGSGKTEYILDSALSNSSQRVLITTYTNENLREINSRLWKSAARWPAHVTSLTWFEFMLRDGVKPYQSFITDIGRIRSINFISQNPPYSSRSDFERYYLDSASNIYSDAVSDLACELNSRSKGKVIARLEAMYEKVLIDEVQDLAGYDLEFLLLLLNSRMQIIMVGDPRQAVYSTNRSNKNKQYRAAKLTDWIKLRVKDGICLEHHLSKSYRCAQEICDFADSIYPAQSNTTSAHPGIGEHIGVVLVHEDDIPEYRKHYSPQELRWNRRSAAAEEGARNFGQVKGQSFDRVLIHPTAPITKFIENGEALKDQAAAKFYVGVTRARHSVAIVSKTRNTKSGLELWSSQAVGMSNAPGTSVS